MIDILIPFWGDDGLLLEAVESVRRQTDPNWRLTVVDDCYPGFVADPLLALNDERIHYVRNERNLGIVANHRRCVSLARERIVVLFGCDDIMRPNYVATVKKAFADYPTAAIVQPGVTIIDESGLTVRTLRDDVKRLVLRPRAKVPVLLAGEEAAVSLLQGNWLYWPSLAFRRETLTSHDFRDAFPIIFDLSLVLDIVASGGSLLVVPTDSFMYRRHAASMSATSAVAGSRFADESHFLQLAEAMMAERGWRRAAQRARWRILSRLDALTLLPAAVKTGQWSGFRALMTHAFEVPRAL